MIYHIVFGAFIDFKETRTKEISASIGLVTHVFDMIKHVGVWWWSPTKIGLVLPV